MIEVNVIAFAAMVFLDLVGAITVAMFGWIIWTVFKEPLDLWGAFGGNKQPVRPEEAESARHWKK